MLPTKFSFTNFMYMYNRLIGLVGRVFTNGPGDLGSIPGRVIPKTLKMVLDISLFNIQQYKVRIEGKVEQFRERRVVPTPTSRCSSYWKGSLLVAHFNLNRLIGLVGRVFANGPGDLGSIPGRVIPKTLKMVLDTSLLNT